MAARIIQKVLVILASFSVIRSQHDNDYIRVPQQGFVVLRPVPVGWLAVSGLQQIVSESFESGCTDLYAEDICAPTLPICDGDIKLPTLPPS